MDDAAGDLGKAIRQVVEAAGESKDVNVSHPTHVVVARNIGGSNRHTSASSTQNVRIVQDGQETHESSVETDEAGSEDR